MNHRRAVLVLLLLGLGLGLQLWFFRHYPQPILFGDPAGYYDVGLRFREALAAWRQGTPPGAAFESVRGLFYLLGVGTLFAVLETARPRDFAFFRDAMAVFNAAAMLGAFALGRRLGRSYAAGVAALVLAAVYPTFAVQTGRLYPDPVTCALFVWAAVLLAAAVERSSTRRMAAAGLVFGAALIVRAQVLEYFFVVIAAALASTLPAWARRRDARRLVVALALGLAPALLAWMAIRVAVGGRDDVVRMGQVTFRPSYPFGFWQQLETDGWTGPYRFKQDPFYREMEARAHAGDPELMRSRTRQLAFTARYVAARWRASTLLVLDNAYRLYDRPANDYKWDFPFPYSAQVVLQRAIVVAGAAGLALFAAESPALLGVFVVPLALAVLHGLVFPWPRYNVPAMPIVMAAAGAWAVRAILDRPRTGTPAVRRAAIATGAALALVLAGEVLRLRAPEVARAARALGWLAVVLLPFAVSWRLVAPARRGRWSRVVLLAVPACLAVPFLAHLLREVRWHETAVRLGGDLTGVEQEIRLTPEALSRLRTSPEAFVVFDLTVPRGDLHGATVTLGGRTFSGDDVVPTMPRLRESTATGGRDRRAYPQWWALRLDPGALPATPAEPLRIGLRVPAEAGVTLRGDRFHGQDRAYEGPSFGDWPRFVALKLEYDGDYRVPVEVPLGSAGSSSAVRNASGERTTRPDVFRIRVVVPEHDEAWLAWETAPAPARGPAAFAFAAFSGTRGEAVLAVDGGDVLRFPLGAREDFVREGGGWRLCHHPDPVDDRARGAYVLAGEPRPGAPLALSARYRAGLSQEPMFFVIDRKRAAPPAAVAAACAPGRPVTDGAARVVDGTHNNYPEDTGRWAVAAVY